MRVIHLDVDGMRCRRCVRQATALLRDVPGIETVTTDSRTGSITVTGNVSDETILHALSTTTFGVRLVDVTSSPQIRNHPPQPH